MILPLIHELTFNDRAPLKALCEIRQLPRHIECDCRQAINHNKKVLAGGWLDCRHALLKRVHSFLPRLPIDDTHNKTINPAVSTYQQETACTGRLTWSIKQ